MFGSFWAYKKTKIGACPPFSSLPSSAFSSPAESDFRAGKLQHVLGFRSSSKPKPCVMRKPRFLSLSAKTFCRHLPVWLRRKPCAACTMSFSLFLPMGLKPSSAKRPSFPLSPPLWSYRQETETGNNRTITASAAVATADRKVKGKNCDRSTENRTAQSSG